MRKLILGLVGLGIAMALSGCGDSRYSILDRKEGPAQITYYVRVEPDTTLAEAEDIASELDAKGGGKSTMTNFFNGENRVENMIYSCSGGSCYDTRGK